MSSEQPAARHGRGLSPGRIGFALLAVAWLVWSVALLRGVWIESRFVGPGGDVTDSLRRVGYIAERLLPFECVVLLADAAAGVVLARAWAASRLGAWGVAACVLWVPSAGLHALVFLVHLLVAG